VEPVRPVKPRPFHFTRSINGPIFKTLLSTLKTPSQTLPLKTLSHSLASIPLFSLTQHTHTQIKHNKASNKRLKPRNSFKKFDRETLAHIELEGIFW
ncbi:unnamed protein product, partial [Coffea canephora]